MWTWLCGLTGARTPRSAPGRNYCWRGKLIASRRIWRHATVPGWRRCSRLMTSGSMSASSTAGPRQHPPSRPARRRSSCSRTSHQRPAGLTQHRVGDPGSPRHGGRGAVRDPGRDHRRLGAGRPARVFRVLAGRVMPAATDPCHHIMIKWQSPACSALDTVRDASPAPTGSH